MKAYYSGYSVRLENGDRYVAKEGIKTIHPIRVTFFKQNGFAFIRLVNGTVISVHPKITLHNDNALGIDSSIPNRGLPSKIQGAKKEVSQWPKYLPFIAAGAAFLLSRQGDHNWGKSLSYIFCGMGVGSLPYIYQNRQNKIDVKLPSIPKI